MAGSEHNSSDIPTLKVELVSLYAKDEITISSRDTFVKLRDLVLWHIQFFHRDVYSASFYNAFVH